MNRLWTTAAACGALFAGAAPALADVAASDTIIVTAQRDPEDPAAVAAARARLSETPGAVAVVPLESYEDRYALGLEDTLRDVPGVFARKKWGEDSRLSIRGSGIGNAAHNRGTLLAQDGIPFNEADGAGDFQLIDPLTARYTEVFKGGNALRFGGALLGGAVNLVTPTGRDAAADLVARLDGGSYETVRGHVQAARAGEDWDAFGAVTALSANGWRDQSDQTSHRATLSVGHDVANGAVRFILNAATVEQEIPGSLTLTQALNTPTIATPANVANDYARDIRSVRGVVQAQLQLSASTTLDAGVYATWKDLHHPIFQVIDQESRNWGAFARFDTEGRVAGLRADAFYGVSLRSGDNDALQWVNVRGSRGAKTAQSRQNALGADVFAEGRLWATPSLALVAGGSYGRAERDFVNLLAPARSASKTYDWFAPRVGALWQAQDGAQVFANITRSVEPPNFSSLAQAGVAVGFIPLEPQEAWTAEAGARGRRGAFTWDVSIYRAALEGELLNFIVSPSIPAATFNAGDTIHQGVEAGLDWRLSPRWRLRQTYTYADFRFDDDRVYGDNRLPVAPEHAYRAEVRYAGDGWFVAPGLDWVPKDVWVDYANTLKSPSYAVIGVNAGWDAAETVEFFLDARNLADERYVSSVSAITDARVAATSVFWPGEGRSVFVGVRFVGGRR
ncbi:MAG: TonB-dependent receptor [Hyphomonadaceae bacterium]|nr:TonB-dependent receptor [Hyphomonadaceae bacterium]